MHFDTARNLKFRYTSLNRIMFGCFNDLWFIISLCTFSSICQSHRKKNLISRIPREIEPLFIQTHRDPLPSFDEFNSKQLFSPPIPRKLCNSEIPRPYVLHNLIAFHTALYSRIPKEPFLVFP